MQEYEYLIVGGGMTADAAARGIRKRDVQRSIGIVSADAHPPYSAPPLSKKLWTGEPLDSIWRHTEETGAALHLGRRAERLDPERKQVTDDRGATYGYRKLLLATGGRPRRLPFGGDAVIYFRTLEDYERLRGLADARQRFAVIGAGFIGSEIAAALAMNHKDVTLLLPQAGIGARVYPPDLAQFLVDYYRGKGVHVMPGETVSGVERRGDAVVVRTRAGREVQVDAAVAGIGIEPSTELAVQAGIVVDDGIVVDESLRTSALDVFAAGDVARFPHPAFGGRARVEHEDNALAMGDHAGRAMAGDMAPYRHVPFFYSDLFDLGYEAVGELDARHEIVSDWKERHREGVIYYLDAGRVRGVLLWNTWGQVDAARRLLAEPGPFDAKALRGRLPA